MELTVAAPYPVSIWYTQDVYEMMDDAVNAAAAIGADFQYEGYMVTGAGFIIDPSSRAEEPVYRGYLTFIGRAPKEAMPIAGSEPASKGCQYGVFAGLGFVVGIISGAALIWALR